MSYHMRFLGRFDIDPPLNDEQVATIKELHNHDKIVDVADLPPGAPEYFCCWTVTDDGRHIVSAGTENAYHFAEWIDWFLNNIFDPGQKITGEVTWQGEDVDDRGRLTASGYAVKKTVEPMNITPPKQRPKKKEEKPFNLDADGNEVVVGSIVEHMKNPVGRGEVKSVDPITKRCHVIWNGREDGGTFPLMERVVVVE